MIYYPVNKTSEYLLKKAGFTFSGKGMGWEKILNPNQKRLNRLHALSHRKFNGKRYIDMHWDQGRANKKHIIFKQDIRVMQHIFFIIATDTDIEVARKRFRKEKRIMYRQNPIKYRQLAPARIKYKKRNEAVAISIAIVYALYMLFIYI